MKRLKLSLLATLALAIVCSCTNSDQPETDLNDLPMPETQYVTSLVSKAGQTSYWKNATLKSASTRASSVAYNYFFEKLVITNVVRYAVEKTFDAAPFSGISELYLTEFHALGPGETYLFGELLLTVKHADGEYSCIINSGNSYADIEDIVFSSHKQLTESALVKEWTYPHYNLFIRSKNNGKSFGFGIVASLSEDDNNFDAEPKTWFELQSPDSKATNDTYTVAELI
ncbi:MAG: hypothetical protein LBR84_08050 [Tannerella sp.]|jgi:hypothetical protein|nr:hypothetical protein [Tannerella sp.]